MACLDRLADGGGVEPGAFVACYLKYCCSSIAAPGMRRGLWSRQHAMRCSVHSRASSVERYPVEGRAPGSAPAPAGRTSPSEVEVGAAADRRGASPPSVSLSRSEIFCAFT